MFSCSAASWERSFTNEGGKEGEPRMMEHFEGRVGAALAITLSGELQAIAFTSSVPFEFRLIRNHAPVQLPLAVQNLVEWQTFDPRNAESCYTTLYPYKGGTRGLDTDGLVIETRGLFLGARFVLFVWKRE